MTIMHSQAQRPAITRMPRTARQASSGASRRERGFTLVEMAVVLVVIGVILAAVMIGRDVQRNSEYVRIRQTFVNQWAVAYNTYVQRMGVPFGDDPGAPQRMVNGAAYSKTGQRSGGDMSGVTEPRAVCAGGAAGAGMRSADPDLDLRRLMLEAGIELPQGRGKGFEDKYVYLDTNGNPQELQICFQWNKPGTKAGVGNVMVISGLTPDLARSLAVGIKGTADASTGTFREQGVTAGADDTAVTWDAVNTQGYGDSGASGREAQVHTLVAIYKMNQ